MIRLAAALLGFAGGLPQEEEPPPRAESPNTAHLHLLASPERLTVRAERLAEAGDYDGALTLYEEVLRESPGAVVPLDPAVALGVEEYIHRRIDAWPESGRQAYRRRVDPEVRRRLEAAREAADAEELERLAAEFPHSGAAAEALSLAAGFHLDAGMHGRAAAALERLVGKAGPLSRPELAGRLGLALARAGRKKDLEELARRAEREGPGAEVWIGGKKQDLAGFLRKLAEGIREGERPAPPPVPAWEMMGGHPSGSRLVPAGTRPAPLAWSAPLRPIQYASDHPAGTWPPAFLAGTPLAEHRPYYPAVADGILYVHNETTLCAFNLFASHPEVLWKHEVPEPAGEVLFDDRVVFATTVHGGRVYANLIASVERPEEPPIPIRVQYPFPRRALLALDAFGGKLHWRLGGLTRRDALEENATFATPPTPEGDRLYVGAVRQKLPTNPFEHHVLCLEASTGRILWSTFVASGGTEINLFGNPIRESLGSPVALAGDTLYYCTHHGAIAALEKRNGRIRWIHRYRQIPVRQVRTPFASKSALGWVNSPPIVQGDLVVAAPMDAPAVYGLEARTGALRWARPRTPWIRTPVGLRESTLVLGGEGLEFLDVRTGKLLASVPPDLRGTGRGVVAEDGVLVPTMQGLCRVSWDGSREDPLPGDRISPMRGNLIVAGGVLALGTATGVEVYAARAEAGPTAGRGEMSPDPSVLYQEALRLIQSGRSREGEEILERVWREALPAESPLARAAGRRLYASRMEEGRRALRAGEFEEAAASFGKALERAPDLAARAEASLQRERARAAGGNVREALEGLHRLLIEAGEEVVAGTKVAHRVRQEIDGILKQWGRGVYGFLEEAAARHLAAARRDGMPESLLEVARLFPNSRAAEEALGEAASAQERLGRTDEAIGTLGRFLREYPDSPRLPGACARLARALERRGQREAAAAVLRRLEREFPTAEVEDEEGRKISALDFARRRLAGAAPRDPGPPVARPVLSPPLKKVFSWKDPEGRQGAALAVSGPVPPSAADLLLLHYGTAIRAFDLGRGTPAWTLRTPSAIEFAAFSEEALLAAGDRCAYRLDPRTGRVEWHHAAASPMRGFLLTGGFLCFTGPDPRGGSGTAVSALEIGKGTLAWRETFPGTRRVAADGTILRAAGEALALLTIEPCRVHLIERETGRPLSGGIPFTDDLTAQLEHATPSLALVSSRGRFLEAYALPSGGLRWRSGMSGVSVRELKVAAGRVVVMGAMDLPGGRFPEMALWTVDLENGKILRMANRIDLGDARFLEVDEGVAYFVSREPDRGLAVRAVRLEDLALVWKTRLGPAEAVPFPPVLARDHLVALYFQTGEDGRFSCGGSLLDRSGNLVQNIRAGFTSERPPHGAVAGDRLVFCGDDRVEVYR